MKLTKKILLKYKPVVIAITGNVGKTSTKEAIYTMLKSKYRCRRNEANYNTPVGVAVTIIGTKPGGSSAVAWIKNIILGYGLLINKKKDYPEILIIEIGADYPNDISFICNVLKPKVGVITNIGDIPVHVSNFKNIAEVYQEKLELIKCLPVDGAAILNFDNKRILDFKNLSNAKVISYGFEEGADIYASDFKIIPNESDLRNSEMYYRIEYMGTSIPFQLKNIVGKSYAYAILCAVCVGIFFDMNMVEISESLKLYKGVKSRINILKGINNSWIIDDTYNASPLATLSSIDFLASLPAKRHILAIGDMKELGKYSEAAHCQVGDAIIRDNINLVFSIGEETKFVDKQLISNGFESKNIHHFDKSVDAIKSIYSLVQPGDLILVKGSHSMKMEKISESLAKSI